MDDHAQILEQIIELIAEEAGFDPEKLSAGTTLFGDLYIDGDDAAELLAAFSKKFRVDLSAFVFNRHFGPEGGNSVFFGIFPFSWIRRKLKIDRHKLYRKEPITIQDLTNAAAIGKWIYEGNSCDQM